MNAPTNDCQQPAETSVFYEEFRLERDEILRHKWYESEKAGYDIGFERALLDWVTRYRPSWRERRRVG